MAKKKDTLESVFEKFLKAQKALRDAEDEAFNTAAFIERLKICKSAEKLN